MVCMDLIGLSLTLCILAIMDFKPYLPYFSRQSAHDFLLVSIVDIVRQERYEYHIVKT